MIVLSKMLIYLSAVRMDVTFDLLLLFTSMIHFFIEPGV